MSQSIFQINAQATAQIIIDNLGFKTAASFVKHRELLQCLKFNVVIDDFIGTWVTIDQSVVYSDCITRSSSYVVNDNKIRYDEFIVNLRNRLISIIEAANLCIKFFSADITNKSGAINGIMSYYYRGAYIGSSVELDMFDESFHAGHANNVVNMVNECSARNPFIAF